MLAIHDRLAELYQLKQKRDLTDDESMEFDICMKAFCDWVWRMNKLKNLSLLASETDDVEWQLAICARMDELTHTGRDSNEL